jgi:Flp pilus assembly pilin Flp
MFGKADRVIAGGRSFLADERGQDMVEYSLLLLLLGCVALIYLTGVGASVSSIWSKVGAKLDQTSSSLP